MRDREKVRIEMGIGVTSRSEYKEKYGARYTQRYLPSDVGSAEDNFDGTLWGCCQNYWQAFDGNAFEEDLETLLNSEQMCRKRRMLTDDIESRVTSCAAASTSPCAGKAGWIASISSICARCRGAISRAKITPGDGGKRAASSSTDSRPAAGLSRSDASRAWPAQFAWCR